MTRSVHDFDLLVSAELIDIQVFLNTKKRGKLLNNLPRSF